MRKRLLDATFDDAPICQKHDPKEVVERLVTVTAPITRAISMHSPTTTELVLKRLLADDRREEVFVSKAMLLDKLAHVPERLRPVVAPMLLALEATSVRASQPSFH